MGFLINIAKEGSPPHQHKNYEIIIYTKGSGTFITTEKEIPVSPGKIIIVPPQTTHTCHFEDTFERIYINGEFDQIFSLSSPCVISTSMQGEGMLLAKMIYDNRYGKNEYIASLCSAFAHFLLQSLKMDDEISCCVREIVDEITTNFHDCNLNLSYILKKSGYAEDYIRAHFKKFTGKTPIEFLTKIRIRHACYLIDIYKNSLSLSEIAEKCGYTDYIYFSRKFKQKVGISPREYKGSIISIGATNQ